MGLTRQSSHALRIRSNNMWRKMLLIELGPAQALCLIFKTQFYSVLIAFSSGNVRVMITSLWLYTYFHSSVTCRTRSLNFCPIVWPWRLKGNRNRKIHESSVQHNRHFIMKTILLQWNPICDHHWAIKSLGQFNKTFTINIED